MDRDKLDEALRLARSAVTPLVPITTDEQVNRLAKRLHAALQLLPPQAVIDAIASEASEDDEFSSAELLALASANPTPRFIPHEHIWWAEAMFRRGRKLRKEKKISKDDFRAGLELLNLPDREGSIWFMDSKSGKWFCIGRGQRHAVAANPIHYEPHPEFLIPLDLSWA